MRSLCVFFMTVMLSHTLYGSKTFFSPTLSYSFSKDIKYFFLHDYDQEDIKNLMLINFFTFGVSPIKNNLWDLDYRYTSSLDYEYVKQVNNFFRFIEQRYNTKCGENFKQLIYLSSEGHNYVIKNNNKLIVNISLKSCLSLYLSCTDNIITNQYLEFCENLNNLPYNINFRLTEKNFIHLKNDCKIDKYNKANYISDLYDDYERSQINKGYNFLIENSYDIYTYSSFNIHLNVLLRIIFQDFEIMDINVREKVTSTINYYISYLGFVEKLEYNINKNNIFYKFLENFGRYMKNNKNFNENLNLSYSEIILFIILDSLSYSDEILINLDSKEFEFELRNFIENNYYFLWFSIREGIVEYYRHFKTISKYFVDALNFKLIKENEEEDLYNYIVCWKKYIKTEKITEYINEDTILKDDIFNKTTFTHNNDTKYNYSNKTETVFINNYISSENNKNVQQIKNDTFNTFNENKDYKNNISKSEENFPNNDLNIIKDIYSQELNITILNDYNNDSYSQENIIPVSNHFYNDSQNLNNTDIISHNLNQTNSVDYDIQINNKTSDDSDLLENKNSNDIEIITQEDILKNYEDDKNISSIKITDESEPFLSENLNITNLNLDNNQSSAKLVAINIFILITHIVYYSLILLLLICYIFVFKTLFDVSTGYFVQHRYKTEWNNYNYLFITLIVSLIFNVIVSLLLYSDLLILMIYAVNSEFLAAAISFHSRKGLEYGLLSFIIFSIFTFYKILDIANLSNKIAMLILITIIFSLIGYKISVMKFFDYNREDSIVRKPIERFHDESMII